VTLTQTALATFVDPGQGHRIDVVTGSGFSVTLDTDASGEARSGPGPIESILPALAGCTALDVSAILAKKRQRVDRYQIAVTGERTEEHPMVYTRIVVEHRVSGEVEAEALRRAIELSATRYCPVSAMLSKATSIEHRYRLQQDGGDEVSALVVTTGPDGPLFP
jgi:putative redox protein